MQADADDLEVITTGKSRLEVNPKGDHFEVDRALAESGCEQLSVEVIPHPANATAWGSAWAHPCMVRLSERALGWA